MQPTAADRGLPGFVWAAINILEAVFAVLWTAFWIVPALLARLASGGNAIPLAMARHCWTPGLLLWGIRVRVSGAANVDFRRPHFFVANHRSNIDVVAMFRALPVPLLFVVKEELRRVPLLGWYIAAMGMIFVPRAQRRRSLENLEQCGRRIAAGNSILMFPEGTRSRDGRLGSFKTASFLPAIDTATPVVPVAIEGAGRILPVGGFRVRPGTIRVAIGRPIATAGLERGDRRELAQRVRRELEELLACTDSPVPQG